MRRAVFVLASLAAGCSGLDGTVANVMPFPIVEGPVESIAVTPLALVPAFSPRIFDYYVRCVEGTTRSRSPSPARDTAPSRATRRRNEAIDIEDYWIRCLPPDFPASA